MNPQIDPLHQMLERLGQAHRDGVFSASSSSYPWQRPALKVTGLESRRTAWVRVGLPLAAAAAVAVVFVGPNLFNTRKTVERIAANVPTPNKTVELAELAGSAAVTTGTEESVQCDYNGDGTIDGRDIQAFVDRLSDIGGNPRLEAEYLQRCLLGNR